MHRYETIFVVNPDLSDDETQGVIKKFAGIVSAGGGVPLKLEDWGRRRLAYKIDKFQQGYYVLLDFASQPTVLMELERNLKIDDRIIRFLSVKTGVNINVEAVQQEIAAKAKPKEETQEVAEGEADRDDTTPAAVAAVESEKTPEE